MDSFDFVIIGQGLAGTTLAWHLRWRGYRTVVLDREAAVTSSRVAAGLITPITGKRLAKSWRFDELYAAAGEFYPRVEAATGARFFSRRPIVRLFRDGREREIFARRADGEFRGLVGRAGPVVDPAWFDAPLGGFEMTAAGRVAVAHYLDASRDHFRRDSGYRPADVRIDSDLRVGRDGVVFPRLGIATGRVILCQGFEAARSPWFGSVPFAPAKGDILTLRVPGLTEDRVVNRGVWIAPDGGGLYRAGSTYDRDAPDDTPTPAARAEIVSRLGEFLRLPVEVVGHAAAVRPVVDERKPVLGLHPASDRVGVFNGLGSKGSLLAPFYAAHFAGFLAGEHPIDPEVDVRRVVGGR